MIFSATNFEVDGVDDGDDNPDNELIRFEFMEILVRIADVKYKKAGITNTFAESTLKLIYDVLLPWFDREQGHWGDFRITKLWSIDVDDLITGNMVGL